MQIGRGFDSKFELNSTNNVRTKHVPEQDSGSCKTSSFLSSSRHKSFMGGDEDKNDDNNNNNKNIQFEIIQDDVTLSDNAVVLPEQVLIKTWKLRNISNMDWADDMYVKYCGEPFNPMVDGVKFSIKFENEQKKLSPGDTIEIAITIKAPLKSGFYLSQWCIVSNDGCELEPKLNVKICVVSQDIEQNNSQQAPLLETSNKAKTTDENQNHQVSDDGKPKVDTSYQYNKELETLLGMGFENPDFLRTLLNAHNGKLDTVLSMIF